MSVLAVSCGPCISGCGESLTARCWLSADVQPRFCWGAHNVRELEARAPRRSVGPVSNAAAFLFSEFERLHILETELFTDNSRFLNREKPIPDPVAKNAFEAEIARTRNLADLVLAHSPQDPNAQFADILADGLRGDYIALIEKRNFAGLSFMKAGRSRAEKLFPRTQLITTHTWRSEWRTTFWA